MFVYHSTTAMKADSREKESDREIEIDYKSYKHFSVLVNLSDITLPLSQLAININLSFSSLTATNVILKLMLHILFTYLSLYKSDTFLDWHPATGI